MTAPNPPKAFVSHNHADKALAESLARALRAVSVDAWFDAWEIEPGDSLIQKIFSEGLKDCAVFLVLLSPESITSKWVREELDVALISRLEGMTRVVPIVVRDCEIPMALRALLRFDLTTSDVPTIARRIADTAYGRSAKPPVQPALPTAPSIPDISEHATRIAMMFVALLEKNEEGAFDGPGLMEVVKLDAEQINDAVDELKVVGAIKTHDYLDTHPFNFGHVEATYRLPILLASTGALSFDPAKDIIETAAAVAAMKCVDGPGLAARLDVTEVRINNAVDFLDAEGHVRVMRGIGTAPYDFHQVEATSATRRFVAQHAV